MGEFFGAIQMPDDFENTIDNEKEEESMENIIICAACGCTIENTEYAHEVDGDWYCEDCFNERFGICDCCNEVYPLDELTRIGGSFYCDECRNDNFTMCEHCGEWVENDEIDTVHINECGNTEEWCENCRTYNTWVCSDCGAVFSDNVSYECDEDDDCICLECYENAQRRVQEDGGDIANWRAPFGVRSYNYKPNPCFCNAEAENGRENLVRYGYELEVDKGGESDSMADFVNDALRYTYCKHDGSLHDGFEIVSHPATLAYHMSKKDALERAFEQLVAEGYRSHEAGTCGLHVHISKAAMEAQNPNAVNNMLFIMDHFWTRLVKFSRRTESQLHGDYTLWKDQARDTRDRYYALNLQNTHTVEIRMFRGTLKLNTFLATLQFVDVLTKKCIEITDLRDLQALSWQELVKSDYEELNGYLKERGLYGSEKEIAAEEEERRKAEEEERRKAEEEERRRIIEREERERRYREHQEAHRRELENIRTHIGESVRITFAPDGNRQLVGLTGTIAYVREYDRIFPVIIDFFGSVKEGQFGLHGTDAPIDPDGHSRYNRYFWNCPTGCFEYLDSEPDTSCIAEENIDELISLF